MDAIRLYFHSAWMHMKCQMEYPLSFWLRTLSQLVMLLGELLAVLLLLDRFSSVGQWTAGEVLFFFGVMTVTFYLVEFWARGISNFSPLVHSGALDTMLLRPRGIFLQVLCYDIDLRRIGAMAVGMLSLFMSIRLLEITWTGLKVLVLLESLIGGFFLVMGLFMIEAVLCLRSVKSVEIVNALTYGGRSTCQYPIDIYPSPIRILFLFVAPFALTTHLPAAYILEKSILGVPSSLAFVSPLAGIAFFVLMYVVFNCGMRAYRSTGS